MVNFTELNELVSGFFGVIGTIISEFVDLLLSDIIVLIFVGLLVSLFVGVITAIIIYVKRTMNTSMNSAKIKNK